MHINWQIQWYQRILQKHYHNGKAYYLANTLKDICNVKSKSDLFVWTNNTPCIEAIEPIFQWCSSMCRHILPVMFSLGTCGKIVHSEFLCPMLVWMFAIAKLYIQLKELFFGKIEACTMKVLHKECLGLKSVAKTRKCVSRRAIERKTKTN